MKYLTGILWINVFVIVWLQIFKIIEMWPSAFYLVILFATAVVCSMLLFGGGKSVAPEPPDKVLSTRVKGVK